METFFFFRNGTWIYQKSISPFSSSLPFPIWNFVLKKTNSLASSAREKQRVWHGLLGPFKMMISVSFHQLFHPSIPQPIRLVPLVLFFFLVFHSISSFPHGFHLSSIQGAWIELSRVYKLYHFSHTNRSTISSATRYRAESSTLFFFFISRIASWLHLLLSCRLLLNIWRGHNGANNTTNIFPWRKRTADNLWL